MKIYLNLLPEQQKNEIRRKKTFHAIVQQEILFLMPLLVVIVMLIAANMILKIQKSSVISESEQTQSNGNYKELKKYEDEFGKANAFTVTAAKIQDNQLHWSYILKKIADTIPDGISIDSIATKDFQVIVIGKARNRDNLLALKDALSQEGDCFENLNIPLSNLVVKDNVVFQLDFMVKEACLKTKQK